MAATIWNTADKSANITLSGGSLTATTTSATQGAVRATNSFGSGKLYFEVQLTNATGTLWSIGWANSTASLAAALGSNTNSVVYQPNQTGRGFFNNGSLGTDFTPATLVTICIAFDIGGKLFWARVNGGYWNGSSTADPGSGTGGRSVSTIAAGPYFPIFGDNGSGGSVIANFGATSFGYTIPSGFSGLDTSAQAYNASSKFLGYDVLGPPQSAASSSKFLGYDILGPPQSAASSSKFLGYDILGPPQNAASSSKFLGYAVVQPVPINFGRVDFSWPPPRLPLYKPEFPATGLNPNLFPPPPRPFSYAEQMVDIPPRLPLMRPDFPALRFNINLNGPPSGFTPPPYFCWIE